MKVAELREKTLDELRTLLIDEKNVLQELQKTHAAGELANSHVLRKSRRYIAQINTITAEKMAELKNNDNKEDK